jgi:hypothetical protein
LKKSNFITFLSHQQFGARTGALGLAIFLWMFVVSNNDYVTVMDVPIEVRNLNERKRAYKKEIPQSIKVRLKGSGRAIFKTLLLKDFVPDFKLVIDLDRISEEYDFYLNEYYDKYPQKVSIPSAFDLQYIEVVYPDSLHISLDEYMVRYIPVQSQVLVNPSPGYIKVGKPIFDSSMVKIAGAKEAVQSINFVQTKKDTISDVDHPINTRIALERLEDVLIEYSFLSIKFSQDIQAISERIISEVPVKITNNIPGLVVRRNPSTVSLTIVGGVDYIAQVQPLDINVFINFTSEWSPKRQFYEPKVIVPSGIINWRDLTPRNIELAVAKEQD